MRNPDQVPVYHPPTTQLDGDSRRAALAEVYADLTQRTLLIADLCRVFSTHARNCPVCAPPHRGGLDGATPELAEFPGAPEFSG